MVEQIGDRQKELADVETKIEKLEEKMMNDEIKASTYKKWFNKYAGEKAFITSEIKKLKSDNKGKWEKMMELLATLLDVPGIFEKLK